MELLLDHGANIEMPGLKGATLSFMHRKYAMVSGTIFTRPRSKSQLRLWIPSHSSYDGPAHVNRFSSFADRLKEVVVFAATMWRNMKVAMRCGGNSSLVMEKCCKQHLPLDIELGSTLVKTDRNSRH